MPSTFVAEQRKLYGVFRILFGYTANQEPGGSRRTAKGDGIGHSPRFLHWKPWLTPKRLMVSKASRIIGNWIQSRAVQLAKRALSISNFQC
jgi:hypothetical protein